MSVTYGRVKDWLALTSFPSLMGIVTLAPMSADLMWAGMSSGPSALSGVNVSSCDLYAKQSLTHDGIEPLPWALQLARFCQEHRSYPPEHQSPLGILISASRALQARIIQLTVLVQAQSTARVLNEKVQKANLVIPNFGK